jgi:hypothetical protein
MNMRQFVFSLLMFVCTRQWSLANPIKWEIEKADTLMSKYEKRIYNYHKQWHNLIPTHTAIQYAGSIGAVSVGLGWDYGKQDRWETTVMLGYLPKYHSDKNKITFTLKQNYTPWSLPLKHEQLTVEPLTCGLFFNTIFSEEFWVEEPDRYPKGYYGFSTRIRTHLFVGQRLTHHFKGKNKRHKSVTLYYELNTCDLYVASLFTNPDYLNLTDILHLGAGIKIQLF